MKIGLLYPYDEKKYQEDKDVGLGLDPESLLDNLNILEADNDNNAMLVLAKLKKQLLQLTGKIEIETKNKK